MRMMPSPNNSGTRNTDPRVIVIHTMEWAERSTTAEECARYFTDPTAEVSAHYCVDNDSVVQCVPETAVAWCAPGANHDGIHIELAGSASQNTRQWDDEYTRAMLARAATLVSDICARHRIPIRWLTDSQLADGKTKGLTTHAQVSRVFRKTDHTDPGPNFPATAFLAMVNGGTPLDPWTRHLIPEDGLTGWDGTQWAQMCMWHANAKTWSPCSTASLIAYCGHAWAVPNPAHAPVGDVVRKLQRWVGLPEAQWDGVLGPVTAARGAKALNDQFRKGR